MSILFTYNAQNIPLGLSLSLIILKNKCPEENCLSIPSFVALAPLQSVITRPQNTVKGFV